MPAPHVTPPAHGSGFAAVRAAMQRHIDNDILAGVSWAVLRGRELIDQQCLGWADKEQGVALRADHLHRAFSNTKLITSCAVLLLLEDGRIELDEPVERHLPQLAQRRVLRPGARTLADTEPARGPITIRHLLCHSSGLSYGLLDPGTLLYRGYRERKVLDPNLTLAQMMDRLHDLPLACHPGEGWEYSVATDVLSRLVEIISGQRFDTFLQDRIFDPLGMADTGFVVPPSEQHRLAAYYAGASVSDPLRPGLKRCDDSPYPQAYLTPVPSLSGGGGLVSSLPDMLALIRSLLPGGPTLLQPETLALMMRNHLAPGVSIRFPGVSDTQGKGYGLGGAVTLQPGAQDPPGSEGEFQWGGIAGTHWWISPRTGLAGVLMTQRQWGFWQPYSFEFKRLVHEAVHGTPGSAAPPA